MAYSIYGSHHHQRIAFILWTFYQAHFSGPGRYFTDNVMAHCYLRGRRGSRFKFGVYTLVAAPSWRRRVLSSLSRLWISMAFPPCWLSLKVIKQSVRLLLVACNNVKIPSYSSYTTIIAVYMYFLYFCFAFANVPKVMDVKTKFNMSSISLGTEADKNLSNKNKIIVL